MSITPNFKVHHNIKVTPRSNGEFFTVTFQNGAFPATVSVDADANFYDFETDEFLNEEQLIKRLGKLPRAKHDRLHCPTGGCDFVVPRGIKAVEVFNYHRFLEDLKSQSFLPIGPEITDYTVPQRHQLWKMFHENHDSWAFEIPFPKPSKEEVKKSEALVLNSF